MTAKKKNPLWLLVLAYVLSCGAACAAIAWLLAGPTPLAIVLGAVLGVGIGISVAVENQ
jgi:hypothetical protein